MSAVADHDQPQPITAIPDATTLNAWKRAAAQAAAADVPNGAVIGLGSGSTAELIVPELAARMQRGERFTGVPTSERTRSLAAGLDIPLATLDSVSELAVSIDGADEVSFPALDLIKGRGGALLYEKLVAAASRYRIIIVDATKVVTTLATRYPIPVEVIPFGFKHTAARLAALGCVPTLRLAGGAPFVTDGGHYVLDCQFGPLAQPDQTAARIKGVSGVVDHGLFVGMTERVYVAGPSGVERYGRPTRPPQA
jgi:ribose 5-phosphate isomerase A